MTRVFVMTVFPSFTNYLCKCPIGLRSLPSQQLRKIKNKCPTGPFRMC